LNLTLTDIAELFHHPLNPEGDACVLGVGTDSRTIRPGMVFFALNGTHFNGHQFVDVAFKRGAIAAVVEMARFSEQNPSAAKTLIPVPDTLTALQDLAAFYRKQFTFPIIAVTGSNGKTTTKDMIYAVLQTKFRAAKSAGNLNNHIGVPLNVCALDKSREIAVLEMGANHFGEIRRLCEIVRPTHGVVTNIGKGHLEFFGDLDGVTRAKSELLAALGNGGAAFLNGDDPRLVPLKTLTSHTITYGFGEGCDLIGRDVKQDRSGYPSMTVDGHRIGLSILGPYNLYNALAAVAVGKTFGVSWDGMQEALSRFAPPDKRTELIHAGGGIRIFDDTYNANPSSVEQAVLALKSMPSLKRRAVVLGDMLELGDKTSEEHRHVGDLIASVRPNAFFCVGEAMLKAAEEARKQGMRNVFHFASKSELSAALAAWVREGDGVLVKGSRGMAMEETVEDLTTFLNAKTER
jgi:UDP-N-acetylmuramoyl-tripeptide--D-alanyl-D-alanine ligase